MTLQTLETVVNPHEATVHFGPTVTFNIASYLPQMAATRPNQRAVVLARSGAALTFAELETLSNRYANGLSAIGIAREDRVLVMAKPGFEFLGSVFALFKMGAVPVMIDPGMGVGRMLECIRTVDLDGFVGVPLAQIVRVLRPFAFRSVRSVVTVGKRWFWGGTTLEDLERGASDHFTIADTKSTDAAAILFTSGSTGPAKGVIYEHGMFDAQIRMIQAHYGMEPGEVDVATFPLFAMFSIAMGITVVIPDMDASRPARADPAKIVAAIQEHRATTTFGSPALWKNVATYCTTRSVKLPTLRRVLIAGAPVSPSILERLLNVLSPDADVFTPYGATEALPVSSISGRERLAMHTLSRPVVGTCVGRSLLDADVRLIRITDDPIAEWSVELLVSDGEFGEIVVAGPMVTKSYHGFPKGTALAKIHECDRVWHRMGDIGYRDLQGRLWYCGRKSQRVITERGTLFTDCCEGVFNEHPDVARSALVGVGPPGRQIPVIVIEPKPGRFPHGSQVRTFTSELLGLSGAAPCNRQSKIENRKSVEQVLFHHSLPVDVRHNAKINREMLARWAARRLA